MAPNRSADTPYTLSGTFESPRTPEDLAKIAAQLEGSDPERILQWAIQTYRPRIVMACSFGGPAGMVMLDMLMKIDPSVPVYYLDTGVLFPETYALVDEVRRRYGIDPVGVVSELSVAEQAERCGPELWLRDPDACCAMRKVKPHAAFLKSYDAWISGIRRDQAPTRSGVAVVEWDRKFGLVKVNPVASWDEEMTWTYVRTHGLPYNPLHDRGYPSIGCAPCTRAVAPGEERRSGRWPGFAKIECGLHAPPDESLGANE